MALKMTLLDGCKELILNHNHIQYHGFCSLGVCLQFNKMITTFVSLVFIFCQFDHKGVEVQSQCVSRNTHIKTLDMGLVIYQTNMLNG
jgi:hypothetical protein